MSSSNITNNNLEVGSAQLIVESVVNEVLNTPTSNVWQIRTHNMKVNSQSTDTPIQEDNSKKESDNIHGKGSGKGFGKGSGKGFGKGSGKGFGKGFGKGSGKGSGKGFGKGSETDENTYVKKVLSPEEEKQRNEKTEAFNQAQNIALKKCVDRCNQKDREKINDCLSYEVNYKRTLVMDITEDEIVISINDNTHVYSLKRFLENRYFQNKLREQYSEIIPAGWISLFPGREEGTHCIGIQKRKN
jgi:hypothetical protein